MVEGIRLGDRVEIDCTDRKGYVSAIDRGVDSTEFLVTWREWGYEDSPLPGLYMLQDIDRFEDGVWVVKRGTRE